MADKTPVHPSFREALLFWLKLGFISFGGPSGQIAIMHTELVERKKWISDSRFLHALNYCMLLPGPEATQLAVYCGWLLHKTWGGIVAGVLFVLPSAFILWALSFVYFAFGNLPWIAAVFYGLKPAVTAIVAAAVIRIGRKSLKNDAMWAIAATAFVGIHFLHVRFPFIVFGAAMLGFLGGKIWPDKFLDQKGSDENAGASVISDVGESPGHTKPSLVRAFRVIAITLSLWWLPVLLAGLCCGWQSTIVKQGVFFSKAAMVTFGGAYAVLPYVAQEAVEHYGWLHASQMLDGLGLAETTPGPLIIVLQFVGFLGAWSDPGTLPPLVAGTLGAFITTWTTFVPSFLWILLGAPHIEQLRGNANLHSSLSAVTAAVVGVILNLAFWFALHVFCPGSNGLDWFSVVISIAAFVGMTRWNWHVIPVVFGSGLLGLVSKFALQ